MIRETAIPVVVAMLLVLAGCAGGIGPGPSDASTGSGTVNFYISDERNAIDQFDHLNVTIETVGFKPAEADDDESDDDEVEDNTTASTDTTTEAANNSSEQVPPVEDSEDDSDDDENDGDDADNDDADDDDSDDESDSEDWITRDVQNVTVDLTEYQGENATLLSAFDIPNGTYTSTYVAVSDINGTLTTGEQVNVKLPSNKLHINHDFTVGNGDDVDFVFDITVFKAGNSGKYILKPVVNQSGTDVPFEADDDDDEDDDDETELSAAFQGNVTRGENVTVKVTQNGEAIEGAHVSVDDDIDLGETDANGTISVRVPAYAEEFELEIEYQDEDTELEIEFEDDEDD